jgi:hypothetical protein
MVLGSTIESLLRVFNWFVESYYNGRLPQIKDMRMFPFQHWDSEYSYENSELKSLNMTGRDGETLQFITPKIDTELRHAVDLFRATSSLFSVSSEEMAAAQFTVYEALDSLLTLDQRQALRKTAPSSAFPEHQFLRQKYAKPLRNTPASIAKAKRVLAAIEVIESASPYRRRPGLHVSFIQPQESE